jgi:hypothetical protein
MGLLALAGLASWTPSAPAQIVIRAPFVRVQVGGGVSVQAPFVNVNTYPSYFLACPPAVSPARMPLTPERVPSPSPAPGADDASPPQPVATTPPMTLGQFAQAFTPREGRYEIVLLNPVTRAPTTVRFALPPGTPHAVRVQRRELAFAYPSGQWVRIRFDRQGARVTSRL